MKDKKLKNLTVASGALIIIGFIWLRIQLLVGTFSYFFVDKFLFNWYWLIPLLIGFIGALLFAGKWSDRYKHLK